MIKDVLTLSANSLWSQISLFIFLLCFIGIVIWTFTGRKNRFAYERNLPLDDGVIRNYDRVEESRNDRI